MCFSLFMVILRSLNTRAKCSLPNGGYTVGDGDRCEARTVIESSIADAGHAAGDGDGGQAAAAIESRIADACYGENYNSLEIISLPQPKW